MKKLIAIFSAILAIILLLTISVSAANFTSERITANSKAKMQKEILKCNLNYETEIHFVSRYNLQALLTFEEMQSLLASKDCFKGGSFYGCKSESKWIDGKCYIDYYFLYRTNAVSEKILEDKVVNVVAPVENKNDVQKVKYVHDYIVNNFKYNEAIDGVDSLFTVGEGCCNSFSLFFQKCMDVLDVDCKCIVTPEHEWNAVKVEGKWFNIDATWDMGHSKNGEISYMYFLKCNKDWTNHEISSSNAKVSYLINGAQVVLDSASIKEESKTSSLANGIKFCIAVCAVIIVIFAIRKLTRGVQKESSETLVKKENIFAKAFENVFNLTPRK